MIGEVTRAIRVMQGSVDPIRGNIEALLQAPLDPHPDADLIALGEAFDKTVRDRADAYDLYEEAEQRAEALRPKAPETLIITNFDMMDGSPFDGADRHPVRGYTWTAEQIEAIRAAPPRQGYYLGGGKPTGWRINEKAEQRKAEILAAYDSHVAATKVVEDACGLTATEAEYDRLVALDKELAERIVGAQATTFAGLAVKARVYIEYWGDADISDVSATDHRIIQSVFTDLVRLGVAA